MLLIVMFIFSVVGLYAQEKPLVVVIPSYNNVAWYKKNLDSVFAQTYSNYRVIYIDDCSSDGTGDVVRSYVATCAQTARVTIITNTQRTYALANHYRAVHQCDDDDIIINLDGDDWFAHADVLARINDVYTDPDVWLTYGQYEEYPSGKCGICEELPRGVVWHNAYREHDWITSHLRTFYAWLFKRIRLQDLLCHGRFFQQACDMAFMFPMLEMAGKHVQFIPEVLYIYNTAGNTIYATRLVQQLRSCNMIRAGTHYDRLQRKPQRTIHGFGADVLVIAYGDALHQAQFLERLTAHVVGMRTITIVDARDEERAKKNIMRVMHDQNSPYVFCVHDAYTFTAPCDVIRGAVLLEQTGAHGVYFGLGRTCLHEPPPCTQLDADVWAWQFEDAAYAWRVPYGCDAVLHHKKACINAWKGADLTSLPALTWSLNRGHFDWYQVGLAL